MNNQHEEGASGISRRTWFTIIGQTAIAAGFPGALGAETKLVPPLPPGVYLPSSDHLSHALMAGQRFRPIPPGCPTDYVRPNAGPFAPQFFLGSDFAVLKRLVELLLEAGANPASALAAAPVDEIAEWIDLRMASAPGIRQAALGMEPLYRALGAAYYGAARAREVETATPDRTCREGLEWLAHAAQSNGGNQFLSLSEDRQIAILDSISDARVTRQKENAGTRFFTFLKGEVIRGFYTSQVGLKELDYKGNAYYARSPGCEHAKI